MPAHRANGLLPYYRGNPMDRDWIIDWENEHADEYDNETDLAEASEEAHRDRYEN